MSLKTITYYSLLSLVVIIMAMWGSIDDFGFGSHWYTLLATVFVLAAGFSIGVNPALPAGLRHIFGALHILLGLIIFFKIEICFMEAISQSVGLKQVVFSIYELYIVVGILTVGTLSIFSFGHAKVTHLSLFLSVLIFLKVVSSVSLFKEWEYSEDVLYVLQLFYAATLAMSFKARGLKLHQSVNSLIILFACLGVLAISIAKLNPFECRSTADTQVLDPIIQLIK